MAPEKNLDRQHVALHASSSNFINSSVKQNKTATRHNKARNWAPGPQRRTILSCEGYKWSPERYFFLQRWYADVTLLTLHG
jgi:hypothetical protein